jgi:hypothetical protein
LALGKAVDNAASIEVVGRELNPHAVAEEHPDPVALHSTGRVGEQLVSVVEANPEHPVAERLDDLAFQLDLLLLLSDDASLVETPAGKDWRAPVGSRRALNL